MAKNNNLKDFVTDIADTLRVKTGTDQPINPQDFSNIIKGLMGGEYNIESVILEDGSQELRITSSTREEDITFDNIEYMQQQDLTDANLHGGSVATYSEYETAESQFQILAQRIIGGIDG